MIIDYVPNNEYICYLLGNFQYLFKCDYDMVPEHMVCTCLLLSMMVFPLAVLSAQYIICQCV